MSGYKCRRCRCALFEDVSLLTSHGKPLFSESLTLAEIVQASTNDIPLESCDKGSAVLFLTIEEKCPAWVIKCLNKGEWTKGKLLCPKCRGRLGSFDFTSLQTCNCGQFTTPPVHVNKSRVDFLSVKSFKEKKDLEQKSQTKNCNGKGKLQLNSQIDVWNTVGHVELTPFDFDVLTESLETSKMANASAKRVQSPSPVLVAGTSAIQPSSSGGQNGLSDPSGDTSTLTRAQSFLETVEDTPPVRKQHKRVVSDCSWLKNRHLETVEGETTLARSTTASRTNSSEDVHLRSQGNGNHPSISTSLLRKRFGHRRAISMTATSNRFQFLQDNYSLQSTTQQDVCPDKKKLERQISMETSEPIIPEEFLCPVCLDMLCCPHSCLPCKHTFCEMCLRQLARTQPEKTTCPMCRHIINQCQPQHHLSFLLKTKFPVHYSRRRKNLRKANGKLHPLPLLNADLRHKLGVVMQNRLRGRRLQEICRDHFIMTFFVYIGAVAVLLGVFLLLILLCCKSLFLLFLLVQWILFGVVHFAISAADTAVTISPALISTPTEATMANRVILCLIGLLILFKLWTVFSIRDRHNHHTAWRS